MNTDNLRLAAIYHKCVDDLERLMSTTTMEPAAYARCVERVKNAVNDAFRIMSHRCAICDSEDIRIHCRNCGRDSL